LSKAAHSLSLAEAVAAISSGAMSSEDYTRALLERIAATDAEVQAWASLDPDAALAAARACDAVDPRGPIGGVGIGVKDIVATRTHPTGFGSPIYEGAASSYDAECVARLERAGGFVLGKTVTTEFAFLHPGKTRNPWHSSHTPGGSSSGSAAAVAVGQIPAAIGQQTNGSIIRPAAFCGVVGFKPTRDLLPMDGVGLFSQTFDTLGVFARNVADCARLAASLADEGRLAVDPAPVERTRLAFLGEYPWIAVDGEQQRAMRAAAATLKGAGATVTELALPDACREARTVHRTIMYREGAQQLGDLQSRDRGRMSPELNAALDEGRAMSEDSYRAALAQRDAMIAAATEWLAPFDAVFCAPARGAALRDLGQTGDPACCTLWSLLGFPALTIPIGLADGLPLGLQLASIAGADDGLLAAAQWCEARLPFRGLA
jgi:amidase